MCGIAGILGKSEKTRETIDKMVDVITHRGPDDRGVLVEKDFAFGMRRLSIIDLGGGHQPISNEDDTVTVVFNGEIYNHRELRPELISLGHTFKTDSDTEGLVHLYEQYGPDMLRKLRGMFGFSIFDKKKNQLFIARDFFGIKPIYYRVEQVVEKAKGRTGEKDGAIKFKYKKGNEPEPKITQKIVSFGSEIKSLLEDKKYKPSVNDTAVFNYLAYQYNPLEQTMFEGIYRLLPGHYMIVDLNTGTFKIEPYWHYHFNNKNVWPTTDVDSKNIVVKKGEKRSNTDEEVETTYYQSENEINLAKEVRKVVEDSVAHHLIADVPVGSFLSGGVDSGIIVTTVQNLRKKAKAASVSTFTIGFDHVSEHSEARQVSDAVGSDHTEIVVDFDEYFRELPKIAWHFDEPVADPSAVALYFLAREARKKVKVVLSGEGADELFGGYNIYREPFATSFVSKLPTFVKSIFIKPLLMLPFNFYGKNYIKRSLTPLKDRYIGNANIFKHDEQQKLWKDSNKEASDLQPTRMDMNPYFEAVQDESDSRKMQYIDLNFWLPGDILAKADKMTMAHSLELRVPFLDIEVAKISARIPEVFKYKNGATKYILRKAFESVLPKTTANRKKLGFPTPIKQWLKKQPEEVMNVIKSNTYIKEKFDMQYIEQMEQEHTSGKKDNARKIYILLMFALWYNTFIPKHKS
ncbi:MAG: asparagine synthase (glutamine-hydrolyzing) [Candidatus Pacebacteria bacterium]|nr:asparagine synthase (glutamine-hydrolyzing) [Candidatus Paceibacterota bacterium]